jgi:hypothetical protein
MPSPTERLEARKTLSECRVCLWLSTLNEKDRRGWTDAISNPRYGSALVAAEINEDTDYVGPTIGESSVQNHRMRRHR